MKSASIREAGHLAAGGREPDTASVAAPVLDGSGGLIGAVVVSGPISRFDLQRQQEALGAVLAACQTLQAGLPQPDANTAAPLPVRRQGPHNERKVQNL